MALRDTTRWPRKHGPLARLGAEEVEQLTEPDTDPLTACAADRQQHLATRQCVVDGCMFGIPCPRHGEPAEDTGTWLRPSGGGHAR